LSIRQDLYGLAQDGISLLDFNACVVGLVYRWNWQLREINYDYLEVLIRNDSVRAWNTKNVIVNTASVTPFVAFQSQTSPSKTQRLAMTVHLACHQTWPLVNDPAQP
jgi:hypothetical protein